jgi:lanosterol synthase
MVSTRSGAQARAARVSQESFEPKKEALHAKRKSDVQLELEEHKRPRIQEKTDKTRWRCKDESGRLTWHYLEDDDAVEAWPQSYADKYYLGFDLVSHHLQPRHMSNSR